MIRKSKLKLNKDFDILKIIMNIRKLKDKSNQVNGKKIITLDDKLPEPSLKRYEKVHSTTS